MGDIIKLAATVGPVLGTVVGVWLHARYGRKVRLKISPAGIEVEGQTMRQLREALHLADEYQRNRSKIILL